MRFACFCYILVFSVLSSVFSFAFAEDGTQATASPATTAATANSSRFIRITIQSSTPHIVLGSVYGMSAEIENISDGPVVLDLNTLALSLKPEIRPGDAPNLAFIYSNYNGFLNHQGGYQQHGILKLLPGDSTTVSFDPSTTSQLPNPTQSVWSSIRQAMNFRRTMNFIPGPYSFDLTGSFTRSTADPYHYAAGTKSLKSHKLLATEDEVHYFNARETLQVGMEQLDVVKYAGIGGVLALLVTFFRNFQETGVVNPIAGNRVNVDLPVGVRLVGVYSAIIGRVAGAFFLSAAVTVVASRLSTTQFPVKISVDDAWGALTVGFVSFYLGGKFIDKLSEGRK